MIDKLKIYVKDLPFMKRRELWKQICEIAEAEKDYRRRADLLHQRRKSLIREYEELKIKVKK